MAVSTVGNSINIIYSRYPHVLRGVIEKKNMEMQPVKRDE